MSSMPLCWSWMAFRYEKCAWALVLVWPGPGMTHVPVCHMCVTATHAHNGHTNLKSLCYILSIPICNTNMYFISTVLPTWYQYHNNKTFKYMVENLHKSYKHWVAFLTITPCAFNCVWSNQPGQWHSWPHPVLIKIPRNCCNISNLSSSPPSAQVRVAAMDTLISLLLSNLLHGWRLLLIWKLQSGHWV